MRLFFIILLHQLLFGGMLINPHLLFISAETTSNAEAVMTPGIPSLMYTNSSTDKIHPILSTLLLSSSSSSSLPIEEPHSMETYGVLLLLGKELRYTAVAPVRFLNAIQRALQEDLQRCFCHLYMQNIYKAKEEEEEEKEEETIGQMVNFTSESSSSLEEERRGIIVKDCKVVVHDVLPRFNGNSERLIAYFTAIWNITSLYVDNDHSSSDCTIITTTTTIDNINNVNNNIDNNNITDSVSSNSNSGNYEKGNNGLHITMPLECLSSMKRAMHALTRKNHLHFTEHELFIKVSPSTIIITRNSNLGFFFTDTTCSTVCALGIVVLMIIVIMVTVTCVCMSYDRWGYNGNGDEGMTRKGRKQ
ncbi:uncharacterized protein TM35_000391620 [Trypanosoma theileri]|uniref:Uncharacterized protein n=1 Tax=Trypanosoma theileri TaxID=67003 RepID=A0A1X0NKD9_9TRYP|nr:uncharacterized protein TM35_000391620 [Trypanosoma theileri]ORC84988.1 hypothetical protein TM35_000391620 [Trypanosoma theileri]